MPAPGGRSRPENGPGRLSLAPEDPPGRQFDASAARKPPGWYSVAMSDGKSTGMKSAYELALERMEQQGIERPREDSLSDEEREQVAELRRRAEAKIAELEILHRDRLAKLMDPAQRAEEEADFRRERQRIEDDRDHKIEKLRAR